jgi:hypothetical protein
MGYMMESKMEIIILNQKILVLNLLKKETKKLKKILKEKISLEKN